MRKKDFSSFKIEAFEKYLGAYGLRAFSATKFQDIFERESKEWGVAANITLSEFAQYLKDHKVINIHEFFQGEKTRVIITHGKRDAYTTVSGLNPLGYFCYLTAMEINGLTSKRSTMLYLNVEHTKDRGRPIGGNELTQELLDEVFQDFQRKNSNIFSWGKNQVMVTNGKKTDRLGVIAKESPQSLYCYTDMERTLIDVAVRPAYAGGVSNVLKAFKKAKGKIDVPKLKDYLDRLDYIYPYHQCIGFYLQRAGFDEKDLTFFDGSKPFRFYLAHGMEYPGFDQRWNIYFPEEI